MAKPHRRKFPLQIAISTLFIAITLVLGLILSWHSYNKASDIILQSADDLYARITQQLSFDFNATYGAIKGGLAQLRLSPVIHARDYASRATYLTAFAAVLDNDSSVFSVGIAYADGDYFGVVTADEPGMRARYTIPDDAVYIVRYINKSQAEPGFAVDRQTLVFYDAGFVEIGRSDGEPTSFDPRERPWYRQATSTPSTTKPYLFYDSGKVGLSAMSKTAQAGAVVVFDVTLDRLNETLSNYRLTASSEAVLINANGEVYAYQDQSRVVRSDSVDAKVLALANLKQLDSDVLSQLSEHLHAEEQDISFEFDQRHWVGSTRIIASPGGVDLYALLVSPVDELLAGATAIRNQLLIMAAIVLLLFIPIIWYVSKRISTPLKNLAQEADAISRFDFEETPSQASVIKEVDELDTAMEMMKSTINKFIDLINTLAGEQNLDELLKRITHETLQLSQKDAALIYLLDEQDDLLKAEYFCDSYDNVLDRSGLLPLTLQQVRDLSVSEAGGDRIIEFDGSSGHPLSAILGVLAIDTASVIVLALRNRHDEIIGLLCLCDQSTESEPGRSNVEFVEALSGFSAVTLESRQLFRMQEALLHAFIKLIAGAIDAKSPYTGGHCQRVPEITLMLARAACASESGKFRDFDLDKKQWEELSIACWLHDCGKVTTPEYVVDKATKLETIYDRIHEVRMRFEVLKRDAEIACWQQIADGADREEMLAILAENNCSIDADFAFVAECNVGGEFMAEEKIERLQQIASKSWQRTIDDSLGLSWEELGRKAGVDETLPVEEKLLADKAEHLIARHAIDEMPEDNPWGFKVDTPEYKYNRGELYNLCVKRGTLNDEERYMINAHMIQTIIMLNNLPYPKSLRNVPLIAGSHHETMDGKGYPKRLVMSEQPLTARMMVIADIFEALTASDRPYKKAKTLSESLKILSFMRDDRHIDPDLFELFLRSGVYLEYAEKFLGEDQIDEVDIESYLD